MKFLTLYMRYIFKKSKQNIVAVYAREMRSKLYKIILSLYTRVIVAVYASLLLLYMQGILSLYMRRELTLYMRLKYRYFAKYIF